MFVTRWLVLAEYNEMEEGHWGFLLHPMTDYWLDVATPYRERLDVGQ